MNNQYIYIYIYSIHVPGWLQIWLNLITAPGSVSNEPGSVTWLATKYLKTVSWRNHTEKLTTWWPENISFWPKINIPSAYFTISMLKCLENTLKLSFDSYVTRHAGSFDCLMTSLILITMDNGRGQCAYWQSCKVPNQTHRGFFFRKMYAIKQIKICAEYRDMLPRPRLDLSGTPGLRPIGLSPGSWPTSLGLGSMSRYSAQILICIIYIYVYIYILRIKIDVIYFNPVEGRK